MSAQHTPGPPWVPHQHSQADWSVVRESVSGAILTYLSPGMRLPSKREAQRLADAVNVAIAKATGATA